MGSWAPWPPTFIPTWAKPPQKHREWQRPIPAGNTSCVSSNIPTRMNPTLSWKPTTKVSYEHSFLDDPGRWFDPKHRWFSCINRVSYGYWAFGKAILFQHRTRRSQPLEMGCFMPYSLGLAAFVPSKDALYAITASEMGEEILNSNIGSKAQQAIEAWIDKQIPKPPQ